MKKIISIRELALIGILIVAAAYYFIVHGPIRQQTELYEQEKADIQMQIDNLSGRSAQLNYMQSELDRIYEKADGHPHSLATYSNNKVLIQELNILLNMADEFNLSFGAQSFADSVMRREIQISFRTQSREAAELLVETIEESKNTYLITGFSTECSSSGEWDSILELVNYEYVSPEQESAVNDSLYNDQNNGSTSTLGASMDMLNELINNKE